MKDPPRFLEGDGVELERQLLESASFDVGSDRAYRRVRAAIGVGLVVTAAAEASASATTFATGKAATGAMPALFAKWMAVGAVAGTAFVGTTTVALSPSDPASAVEQGEARDARRAKATSPVRSEAPAGPAESVRTASTSAPAAVFEPVQKVSPARTAMPAPKSIAEGREKAATEPRAPSAATFAPTATTTAGPAPLAAQVSPKGLAEEVAMVDAARAALSRRDATAALHMTASHDAEFPRGALTLDVAVLRIRALLMAGRRAEAEREAQRVLAAHPTGPYAARIHELFTTTNP